MSHRFDIALLAARMVGSTDWVRAQAALELLRCPRDLRSIRGASHLFEEPGALAAVTALARQWFDRHLLGDRAVDVSASPSA